MILYSSVWRGKKDLHCFHVAFTDTNDHMACYSQNDYKNFTAVKFSWLDHLNVKWEFAEKDV